MLYTYIHHKEYKGASWDVAHLYEHLVTISFQSYLESLGMHPGLVGNTSGDTFEQVVFLRATFYDKHVANAYEHFLTAPSLINTSYTPQALAEIETEEQESFSLRNKKEFDAQLALLISSPWVDNSQAKSTEIDESSLLPQSPFATKKSAKDFQDVVVAIYADNSNLDEDEQTLFLRLSAVLNDVISYAIRKEQSGSYHIGLSPISKDDGTMGSTQHIRFKRPVELKRIQEIAEQALHNITKQANMPLIIAHFNEFGGHTTWKNFIIDYYKHTGIVTSNEHIASLATAERTASIIAKLSVHVRLMRKGDEEWFS